MSGMRLVRLAAISTLILPAGFAVCAHGQSAPSPVKPMAFEVVSIRQNLLDPPRGGPPPFGATPDGYRITNMPLILPILAAFVPKAGGAFTFDRISGLPDWAMQTRWDIDAKVADEDRAEWQKPATQAAMLQAMFEERCKLSTHREMKESTVYLLTVGKAGPKLKETNPDEEHPGGIKMPWGGVLVPSSGGAQTLYGASMTTVASVLSLFGGANLGRQIQDKTGLTGKYDITFKPPTPPAEGEAVDPSAMLFSLVEQLGLKLESGKSQVETLVIDHMEKPSAN
jgi:uncharacterized protein (TIGR03435 family)